MGKKYLIVNVRQFGHTISVFGDRLDVFNMIAAFNLEPEDVLNIKGYNCMTEYFQALSSLEINNSDIFDSIKENVKVVQIHNIHEVVYAGAGATL